MSEKYSRCMVKSNKFACGYWHEISSCQSMKFLNKKYFSFFSMEAILLGTLIDVNFLKTSPKYFFSWHKLFWRPCTHFSASNSLFGYAWRALKCISMTKTQKIKWKNENCTLELFGKHATCMCNSVSNKVTKFFLVYFAVVYVIWHLNEFGVHRVNVCVNAFCWLVCCFSAFTTC